MVECGAWQQPLAQAGPQSGHWISSPAAASKTWALEGASAAQAWDSKAGRAKTSVSSKVLTKPSRLTISRKDLTIEGAHITNAEQSPREKWRRFAMSRSEV